MFALVNKWVVFTQLLPASHCLLCEAPIQAEQLCRGCREDLPWLTESCALCSRPLPRAGLCSACQRRRPPYQARAACRYEYPLTLLIQHLKFRGQVGLAHELGSIMLEKCSDLLVKNDNCCLIPMPLHWRRQCWRGFNQALELARPLARALDLPLRTDLCWRRQATRPQANLRGRLRRENVRAAFEVCAKPLPQRVIIVDDVLTSGHTAAALSHCLRRAGVREISVLALAKAGIK